MRRDKRSTLQGQLFKASSLLPTALTEMRSTLSIPLLAATLVAGLGHNDWDRPCWNGECAYDLPAHKGQSGTIKLFAANPYAIADITPAAGWVVLDCDPQAVVQEIRLVCMGGDTEGAGCDHLTSGAGPLDKYVRLPENCSQSPFGRITKYWVHADQSVPEHHGVIRRDNGSPHVYAISIDDKFDQIDYNKHGDVRYVAYGVSVPGLATNFAIPSDISDPDIAKRFISQAVADLRNGLRAMHAHSVYARFAATPAAAATIPLPSASDLREDESTSVTIGSSSTPLIPLKLKSEPKTCESSGHNASGDASFSVGLDIDTYIWGRGKWGGGVTGTNGAIDAILGFLEDFDVNLKHSFKIYAELNGEFSWDFDTPPVSIPEVTALHLGVVQLGLMGGAKIATKFNVTAEASLTSTVQYGLQHISLTIPSKKDVHLTPYFNSTPVDGLFGGEVSAVFGVLGGITPKIMVGASTSGGSARVDAWLGVEVGLALAVKASQSFLGGSSGVALSRVAKSAQHSPSRVKPSKSSKAIKSVSSKPTSKPQRARPAKALKPRSLDTEMASPELAHCLKLIVRVKVGAEARVKWDWLYNWIGWQPGVSGDLDLFKHDWTLSENGGLCGPKRRSVKETWPNMQVLSKRAAKSSPTHTFPPTDVKRAPSCLPKDIVGKAKSFLNQKFPLPV
ncbi:hypothetical protein PTI98_008344 [Pleurotus ostreatus]|nr:hypothetical protein PTI98_008344 [Pleurotus ostreatus]